MLIDAGAKVKPYHLYYALRSEASLETIQLLLDRKVKINQRNSEPILHIALEF